MSPTIKLTAHTRGVSSPLHLKDVFWFSDPHSSTTCLGLAREVPEKWRENSGELRKTRDTKQGLGGLHGLMTQWSPNVHNSLYLIIQ